MKFWQRIIINRISENFLFFTILLLLFTLPGWLYCITIYNDYPLLRMIGWLLFITAMPALISWLCCFIKSKIVRTFIYIIAVSLFAVNLFLILNFSTMISPWILLLIHETNMNESSEFFETYSLSSASLITYAFTILTVCIIIFTERISNKLSLKLSRYFTIPLCLWFIIGIYQAILIIQMFTLNTQSKLQEWYDGKAFYCIENTPANLLYSLHHLYINSHENDIAWEATEKALQSDISRINNDTIDIVLVIGESYNKYHASIYGYNLNTTPIQYQEQQRSNLFVFKDAVSPYNMTTLAVKNMLSTNSISLNQSWNEYPLVTTIFRQAGFDVAMWDNQKSENSVLFHDFSNNSLLYSKKMIESTYHHLNKRPFAYDQQLVDSAFTIKRYHSSTFTVFHLMGQHTSPKWRYPQNDKHTLFTADSIHRNDLNEEQRKYIAEYDNATYYNDYVIGNIINHYRHRNAVILYLSDHGDEVYDYRNVIGRTHEPAKDKLALKYQYDIPMVLWCSDIFIQRYPKTIENIRKAVLKPFTSDNVPHLLMSLANIRSHYYEPLKDVLSEEYECGTRIIQNTTDYDAVMNQ